MIVILIGLLIASNVVWLLLFLEQRWWAAYFEKDANSYFTKFLDGLTRAVLAERALAALRDDIGHERADRIVREREAA